MTAIRRRRRDQTGRRGGIVGFVARLGTLAVAVAAFSASAAASPSGEAALKQMSAMLASYFAGSFDDLSASAEQIAASVPAIPVSPAERAQWAWAYVAVGFGASLDEEFAAGEQVLSGAAAFGPNESADGDLSAAVAFADAFNALRRGRQLKALLTIDPVASAPSAHAAAASVWRALAGAVQARAMGATGRHGAAVDLSANAEREIEGRLGADHPFALLAALWHAETLVAAQRPEAEAAIEALFDRLGDRLQKMPVFSMSLASLAVGFVAFDEIDALADRIFETALAVLPAEHTLFALALEARAYAAFARGDYRGQLDLLLNAVRIYEAALDRDAPVLAEAIMNLAMAAASLNAPAEALAWSDMSVRAARQGTGWTSSVTALKLVEAATIRSIAGQPEQALALIGDARRILDKLDKGDLPRIVAIFVPLQEAKALLAAGRPAEAAKIQEGLLATLGGFGLAGTLVDFNIEADHALALRRSQATPAALLSSRRALAGLLEYRNAGAAEAAASRAAGASLSHPLRLSAETLVHSAWRSQGQGTP